MDELNLKGKKYISSKRAAEITGYTKDYVGQLARGGKISAERVGRVWYIDEEALRAHASVAHEESVAETENGAQPSKEPLIIPDQGEVLPLHYLQMSPQGNLLKTWSQVRYVDDHQDLLPLLRAKTNTAQETTNKIRIHTPSIHHSPLHAPDNGIVKSVDGVMLTKKKNVSVINPTIVQKAITPARKGNNLTNAHYALLGFVAGVLVAISALVTGFYTPNEWTFSSLQGQTASSGELENSFLMIFEFFSPIFTEGIDLIRDFLTLLFASFSDFFNQGLEFLLDYF